MRLFEQLLLFGRPGSGKTEFVEYMRSQEARSRSERYHLGEIDPIDTFAWFQELVGEDDTRESRGEARRHSNRVSGRIAIAGAAVFDHLVERANRKIVDEYLSQPEPFANRTVIVQLSRGGPAGYVDALRQFAPEVLRRTAVLYFEVSFTESWRRNLAGYQAATREGREAHMVPREDMERFYRMDDWPSSSGASRDGYLRINEVRVPYVTMSNEPESEDRFVLDERYSTALTRLIDLSGGR